MVVYLLLEGLASVPLTHFEAGLRIGRSVVPELAQDSLLLHRSARPGARRVGSLVVRPRHGRLAGALRRAPLVARAADDGAAATSAAGHSPCSPSSMPLGSIWLLAFAVTYADALILGSRFPDAVVGGYMFAYVWAFFASRVLQQPIGRALYPALVQFGDRPAQQFLAYRLATKVLLAIEVPAALFLFLNADLVVQILGGVRYADQADLLRLLAFAPLVDPLGRFGGELLVARNRDRDRILSLVLHLTALVAGGLYLSHRFGPVGMAWANFLAARRAGADLVAGAHRPRRASAGWCWTWSRSTAPRCRSSPSPGGPPATSPGSASPSPPWPRSPASPGSGGASAAVSWPFSGGPAGPEAPGAPTR